MDKLKKLINIIIENKINSGKKLKCEVINLTQELIDEVNKFDSSEYLLRSGGISIEALGRAAFGFTSEDVKALMPKQLNIKWKEDLENVRFEQEKSGLSKIAWANKIDLSEPVEVAFEKNKFFIEDGHHRYYAARILNKPLNVDLTIKMNPITKLAPSLTYDNFHRCLFNQVKGLNYTISESALNNDPRQVSKEEFEDVLLDLSTLDLEDDQVRYPKTDSREHEFLFGGNNYNLYILDKQTLPSSGPFEISITDDDDEVIGFIRGTKSGKIISFNLIHIKEENRGQGIGSDIYESFLKDGYIIKSDNEITDSTYSLYSKLVIYGYKPLLFADGTVGLMK